MTYRLPHYHISQLATSTICNDTFYIILDKTHRSSHYCSHCTNNHQEKTRSSTSFQKRICSSNLKNTCRYLCCCMNLCRYWGWTLYSVCKPNMQSNLSTFSQSSTCKKKTNKIRVFCRYSYSSYLCCICRPQIPPTKKQSNYENCITNTIHQYCFLSSFCSTLTMEPKTNQQIATDSNEFPSNLKENQIICSYLYLHRTCKKTQITKKTRLMRISYHISYAINMDTKTYKRYC
jgi:hypothetical protein